MSECLNHCFVNVCTFIKAVKMMFKGRKTPDKPKEFVDILPSKVKYNDITAKVDVTLPRLQ